MLCEKCKASGHHAHIGQLCVSATYIERWHLSQPFYFCVQNQNIPGPPVPVSPSPPPPPGVLPSPPPPPGEPRSVRFSLWSRQPFPILQCCCLESLQSSHSSHQDNMPDEASEKGLQAPVLVADGALSSRHCLGLLSQRRPAGDELVQLSEFMSTSRPAGCVAEC